jgi:hypothetical protein
VIKKDHGDQKDNKNAYVLFDNAETAENAAAKMN